MPSALWLGVPQLPEPRKLTYYFSDKAHNPVTFGKGDVIGHLTLADGTKTEITVTSV